MWRGKRLKSTATVLLATISWLRPPKTECRISPKQPLTTSCTPPISFVVGCSFVCYLPQSSLKTGHRIDSTQLHLMLDTYYCKELLLVPHLAIIYYDCSKLSPRRLSPQARSLTHSYLVVPISDDVQCASSHLPPPCPPCSLCCCPLTSFIVDAPLPLQLLPSPPLCCHKCPLLI